MEVELTQGKVAQIDDSDWPLVSRHKWHAHKENSGRWYARTTIGRKTVLMHNLILGRKGIDHIDGDGLRNTRDNLRPATPKQNMQNKRAHGRSRYKGVSLNARTGRWRATMHVNGKQLSLGYYATEIEAAGAYNQMASEMYGEFAWLNPL